MLRQLRVAEGMDVWDGFDSAPVTHYRLNFGCLTWSGIQAEDVHVLI